MHQLIKKNDVIEIEIDGIGYEGEGIAHLGGYTVFIRYALRGEKVRALVILAKPTFAVAKLQEVLRPSPDRAVPFCPVYYTCGGCGLQHMTYEAQLRYKQESVKETFFKAAHLSVSPPPCIESPKQKAYRNKMNLPVRGYPAAVGFFASGSHRVVPVNECPIQFEGNGKLIQAFLRFLHENDVAGYNETTGEGVVRHLSVRKIGDYATVTVVTNGKHAKKLTPFDAVLKELYGEKYAYYLNENTSRTNRILGENSTLVGGKSAPVCVDGLDVCVHPHSFFQVNDGVREKLYAAVAAAVSRFGLPVIDAYSGAGVLSALLARSVPHVTAVEIEPRAVSSANDLIQRNGIQNVTTVCGDCAQVLPDVLKQTPNAVVVLDPPRAGCAVPVLNATLAASPAAIVYVSCNPATLARDVAILTQGDYAIVRLTPFDMFPQTPNVETLCVLSKKISDGHSNG